jgi:hypothetical protein
MAKILQFRLFSSDASGNVGYEIPVKKESPPRRKEPIVQTIMPDQRFPVGHQDFRPLLQRDGLILLSWARWEDWNGSLERRYIVTWATAQGKCHHYASRPIPEKDMASAVPERRADRYFYRGLYGNGYNYDIDKYPEERIADYLYLTAPFDLTNKTIPGFIRVLKALGSTVNFDVAYTLTQEREKRSKAREYLDQFASTQTAKTL